MIIELYGKKYQQEKFATLRKLGIYCEKEAKKLGFKVRSNLEDDKCVFRLEGAGVNSVIGFGLYEGSKLEKFFIPHVPLDEDTVRCNSCGWSGTEEDTFKGCKGCETDANLIDIEK